MTRINSTLVTFAMLAMVLTATAAQVQAFPFARLPSESAVREAMTRLLQLQKEKVTEQINDFIRAAESWGFKKVTEESFEMINNGSRSVAVRLENGSEYAVAARHGSACNLHLVLKDAFGHKIASSEGRLHEPGFIVPIRQTGLYTLFLELAACSTDVSQVGIVVLAQPDHRPKPWRDAFTDTSQTSPATTTWW